MNLNRLISLILGLVVLVLLFVWINNRLKSQPSVQGENTTQASPTPDSNDKNPFASLFNKLTNDATPTPQPTTPAQTTNQTGGNEVLSEIHSIPKTGAPTVLIPILISALGVGIKMKKSTP